MASTNLSRPQRFSKASAVLWPLLLVQEKGRDRIPGAEEESV